jgi:hypothetical protein
MHPPGDAEDQKAAVSVAREELHEASLARLLPGWRLRLRAPLLKVSQRELPFLVWIQVCLAQLLELNYDPK